MKPIHFYESIQKGLPPALRSLLWYLAHKLARRRYKRFIHRTGTDWNQSIKPGPVPPEVLITTTSLLKQEDIHEKSDPNFYYASGYLTILRFLTKLHSNGFDFRTSKSVLELGCGTARVLRHLRWFLGMQLVGTDINRKGIDWCRLNLEGIEFHVNELIPPLSFAQDAQFDFVFAQSVFTHIPREWQKPWIDEMNRILRPGGYFLCTVSGSRHIQFMLNEEEKRILNEEGHLTLDARHPRSSYSTRAIGSWDVFQTREENRRMFGSRFEILEYGEGPNLDLLVLRRS